MFKKTKNLISFISLSIFIIALAANIHVSLSDPFSILSSKAYAATYTSTAGDSSSAGYTPCAVDCTVSLTGSGEVKAGTQLFSSAINKYFKIPVNWNFDTQGNYLLTFSDARTDCLEGGSQPCTYSTCADFYNGNTSI